MGNVEFHFNLSAATTPLPHFWEHTVGSVHAPLPLRARCVYRRCRARFYHAG